MKLKCFVFLIFLNYVCGASPTVSPINESEVKSYSVLRRSNHGDQFTVKFKDGYVCASSDKVHEWCQSLSAFEDSPAPCSCTCNYALSFLPPLQTCINTTSADRFGGECVQIEVFYRLAWKRRNRIIVKRINVYMYTRNDYTIIKLIRAL